MPGLPSRKGMLSLQSTVVTGMWNRRYFILEEDTLYVVSRIIVYIQHDGASMLFQVLVVDQQGAE